jgi:hypothetical protein
MKAFGVCTKCQCFVPPERWPRGFQTFAVDEAPGDPGLVTLEVREPVC